MTERVPPNLKAAQACGDCKYYDNKGECLMYEYPVDDEEHCDSWTPADPKEATKRAWGVHRRRLQRSA
jgi:hypothetical protein